MESNAAARGQYGWQETDYDAQTGLHFHRA